MIKKDVEKPELAVKPSGEAQTKSPKQKLSTELAILFFTLAFAVIFLILVAPLERLSPTPATAHIPLGSLLVKAGAWLPSNLFLSLDLHSSQVATGNIEFLLLMVLAFGVYGLCALFLHGQGQLSASKNNTILLFILIGATLAGFFMLFSPSLLSHDIFVYAGFGRLMVIYHANPYFVPPSAFPHEITNPFNDWSHYTSAYGPFWLVACALSELFSGTHPLRYIIFFRVLGLATHLVNILLVAAILRKMGRSPRTVTLGAQLYAWNPLVMLESSQSGHIDIFMLTFILLGTLFAVHAEKQAFANLRSYLLAVVAFTLAVLIKFTAVPLVVLFIIALACYKLRPTASTRFSFRESLALRWKPALVTVLSASVTSGIVVLIFYGPFFIGHSIHQIANSFTAPPSSHGAHKSLLDGIVQWNLRHPLPARSLSQTLVTFLSNHTLWDLINIMTLASTIVIGAIWLWKTPTVRTFLLASLLALGALLVVAPWFLPWYVTWLVAPAVVCLPVMQDRRARALLAFSLTFSVSAFILYLYNGSPPAWVWNPLSCLLTYGPPLLAFLIFLGGWRSKNQPAKQPSEDVEAMEITA